MLQAAGQLAVADHLDHELATACDRVLVFFQGRICAELQGDALTTHAMLEAMNTGAAAEAA